MIFVDESIQSELGYICLGFAYCDQSPDQEISDALASAGLTPKVDEYKSGIRMVGAGSRHDLRDRIYRIVQTNCKVGVYIGPLSERPTLLESVIETASEIVKQNALNKPHAVFVDEGLTGKDNTAASLALTAGCDSKLVMGIQLADFVAYHCSYLLKCTLTGKQKKVLIDSEPHPLSGQEVDLDWIVRTDFRRNFFAEKRNIEEIEGDDWFFKISGYGAFFSPNLREEVKAAAEETFGSMYLGCVW